MAAHPLGFIVAGLSCLGVGAAAVTIVASPGAGAAVEEGAGEPEILSIEQRYLKLDALRLECATGAGDACYELGGAYQTREDLWGQPVKGEGVKRDDRKAAHYFRLACDLGVKDGCRHLAQLYENGKGVQKDREEAARLYARACEPGDEGHCESLKAPARRDAGPGLRP